MNTKTTPDLRAFSRRTSSTALGAAMMTLAALYAGVPSANAATKDIAIPKSVAIAAINSYMSGFSINLDNWGSFHKSGGGNWHANNSYIQTPSGARSAISIPLSPTLQSKYRRYNAYIDDMATQSIDVKADGSKLKLRVFFESAGNEIRIGCVNRRKDKPCAVHLMKHTGDINNAHLYLWFKPVIEGNKLRLAPTDAAMDFDLKLDSWILDNLKNVASHFVNIKGKVQSKTKEMLLAELKREENKNKLSFDLNKMLAGKLGDALKDSLGNSAKSFIEKEVKISGIKSQGSNYVVTVTYPDIVTANSVDIVSFKSKSKTLSATCPFKFGFDATIKTNVKVSGSAWMEDESGGKSAVLPWKMNKAGSATSVLAREIKGAAGQTKTGWSRLVVSWKGTAGQTFTVKSGKAVFKTTCLKSGGGIGLSN
jgi:hypothetical protein